MRKLQIFSLPAFASFCFALCLGAGLTGCGAATKGSNTSTTEQQSAEGSESQASPGSQAESQPSN